MTTPALTAVAIDVADLVAMLHVLARAEGDEDLKRTLRLLARHGEACVERLETLITEENSECPTT